MVCVRIRSMRVAVSVVMTMRMVVVVMRVIVHMAVVVVMVICLAGHFSRLLGGLPDHALTANSVIMPVSRCGMWWQCSIQRATSPASSAISTIDIGGT